MDQTLMTQIGDLIGRKFALIGPPAELEAALADI